ncbi:ester cyclase [Chitinophaga sp. Ak27]|uniref:ester cyclase n=1 Tax=Chitinophaga sp. Ak27 TaxID=2726116 RepID=UPI00145D2A60|nr:ester cyclase [Chitinophaga sp. Ak27]NLU92459.1 SnoaL-like domain-containing protein [Chitinophaga sp. Ak27]
MIPVPARVYLLSACLLFTGISNAQTIRKKHFTKQVNTTIMEANKQVIKELYEKALNQQQTQLLPSYISDDYTGVRGGTGAAGFQTPIAILRAAFPDIHYQLEDLLAEGDKVMVRWKWTGTHTGTYLHLAPTGKVVTNDGMAIYQLRNGKVSHAEILTDRLGFLQALQVLPPVLPSPPHPQQVAFIDKFLVPAAAIAAFRERTGINRRMIKTLPGFISDAAYEYTDDKGNLICVTVAQWESREALAQAKTSVQASYQASGFNMAAFLQETGIVADRGVYMGMDNQ